MADEPIYPTPGEMLEALSEGVRSALAWDAELARGEVFDAVWAQTWTLLPGGSYVTWSDDDGERHTSKPAIAMQQRRMGDGIEVLLENGSKITVAASNATFWLDARLTLGGKR